MNTATTTTNRHPLADAPDVLVTVNVTSMCYACREPIPEGERAIWRRTHGNRHETCKHPEPTDG